MACAQTRSGSLDRGPHECHSQSVLLLLDFRLQGVRIPGKYCFWVVIGGGWVWGLKSSLLGAEMRVEMDWFGCYNGTEMGAFRT